MSEMMKMPAMAVAPAIAPPAIPSNPFQSGVRRQMNNSTPAMSDKNPARR